MREREKQNKNNKKKLASERNRAKENYNIEIMKKLIVAKLPSP